MNDQQELSVSRPLDLAMQMQPTQSDARQHSAALDALSFLADASIKADGAHFFSSTQASLQALPQALPLALLPSLNYIGRQPETAPMVPTHYFGMQPIAADNLGRTMSFEKSERPSKVARHSPPMDPVNSPRRETIPENFLPAGRVPVPPLLQKLLSLQENTSGMQSSMVFSFDQRNRGNGQPVIPTARVPRKQKATKTAVQSKVTLCQICRVGPAQYGQKENAVPGSDATAQWCFKCAQTFFPQAEKIVATGFDEEKPYTCPFEGCGYRAAQRRYIGEHLRIHTGRKPYSCNWPGCEYKSSGSGHLQRHMRVHTGEKPYTCSWAGCNYEATQSGHLTAHMRKHTGERPFTCTLPGCGYAASRSWHLARHMRAHQLRLVDKKADSVKKEAPGARHAAAAALQSKVAPVDQI